ncbi:MAG TPA: hypothetical protein PKO15_03665, partial [Fibrobacteria bacterium]|nr:hypothetical protein [Fibrobacteria bacterium]
VRMSDTAEIETPAGNLERFSTWTVSWDAERLRIGRDGKELFERVRPRIEPRRVRCAIGTGGGLRLAHLLVLDRALAVDSLSW